jgi:hypothetical protein
MNTVLTEPGHCVLHHVKLEDDHEWCTDKDLEGGRPGLFNVDRAIYLFIYLL